MNSAETQERQRCCRNRISLWIHNNQLASPVIQFHPSKGIQTVHVQFLVSTRLATAVVVLVGFEGLYRFVLVPNGPSTATVGSSGVCVVASWGVRHRVLHSWGTASKELPVLVLG
jgi:hypothetical protein